MNAALTSRIREEARRLGFFKIGVTRTRVLPEQNYFESWLERGMHGEMRYMERQAGKRKDPGQILETARSIIVLAMNYCSEDPPADETLKGRISRYAWGDDYHFVVKNRLNELIEIIRQIEPSAEGLSYVDTGPIMEKVWGAHSALGWMGKHTNLITREQGSWFFIGVILLNTELEYDPKETDFCGSCIRCMTACPTGAIVAPYVLDARLCISYLTIELRGPIPRNLRASIGNRIYGCDDCQEVCPWNRFAVRTEEQSLQVRDESRMPELQSLVNITPQQFSERFKQSPVLRARRDGFVRNVAVALGNSHRPEAVPALKIAIQDNTAMVRAHAAWALGQIAGVDARQALQAALAAESDPGVLEEIRSALEQGWPA